MAKTAKSTTTEAFRNKMQDMLRQTFIMGVEGGYIGCERGENLQRTTERLLAIWDGKDKP